MAGVLKRASAGCRQDVATGSTEQSSAVRRRFALISPIRIPVMPACSPERPAPMRYALFGIAFLAACSSGGPTTQPPPPPPVSVASVSVTPDTATLAVGATLQLTATVRDSASTVLTGERQQPRGLLHRSDRRSQQHGEGGS